MVRGVRNLRGDEHRGRLLVVRREGLDERGYAKARRGDDRPTPQGVQGTGRDDMTKRKAATSEPVRFMPRPHGGYSTMNWQDTVLENYGICCETCALWRTDDRRNAIHARCDRLSHAIDGTGCVVETPHRFGCFGWKQYVEETA